MAFKKVSAIYKCFDVLELLARNTAPMGVSEIAAAAAVNKSTVYNMLHSLADLTVLNRVDDKFCIGPKFFLLGQSVDYESLLTGRLRPYLQQFSERTGLTTSLGIRSGFKLITLERVMVPGGIDVINKSRTRSLVDGVHGTAVLALLADDEVTAFLTSNPLTRFTPRTVTDRNAFLRKIAGIRKSGVAFDREEYHAGIWAIAAAFQVAVLGTQAVIWIFGLESRAGEREINAHAVALREMVDQIERELAVDNKADRGVRPAPARTKGRGNGRSRPGFASGMTG